MPLPMMADRKLVTVGGLNFNTMRQSEVDALCAVLERLDELDYNVLIITVAADCFDPGYLPKRPSETLKVERLKRDGEKAFCARQKISFHHTLKPPPRQPRVSRNNATFLAKILAFSTKPSVSVVFSSKTDLRRLPRPLFDALNAKSQRSKVSFQFATIVVLIERGFA
jgi:hypothetical protein